MKSDVTFVFIAFHPENKSFRELLLHLFPYNVIVVDNGGVGEIGITNVWVIHTSTNLGYGGGANVGIRKALENGAQWVVVMNQDVEVSQKAVQSFVEKLEQTPVGIAGPFMGHLDPKRWTTNLASTPGIECGGRKQMYISGSVMAIHRDVIERVGYFYEPYFLYYEEVDLCIRAERNGYKLTHVPKSGMSHTESVSLGAGSYAHEYYLARNHMLFVQRCAPWSVKIHEWSRLPKTIWEHRISHNIGALMGIRDYILRRFGALKKLS